MSEHYATCFDLYKDGDRTASWLTPGSGVAVRPTPKSNDLYLLTFSFLAQGISGSLLTLLAMTGVGSKSRAVTVNLRIGRFTVVVILL